MPGGDISGGHPPLTMIIGRKLPSVIQSENQAEAELLAEAMKIRLSGEEAKPSGEGLAQRGSVWLALRRVLKRWRQLLWQLMGTTMVSQMDLLLAPVVAWMLRSPKYLAGTMALGELPQASAAFETLQMAFKWLVDNFSAILRLAGCDHTRCRSADGPRSGGDQP